MYGQPVAAIEATFMNQLLCLSRCSLFEWHVHDTSESHIPADRTSVHWSDTGYAVGTRLIDHSAECILPSQPKTEQISSEMTIWKSDMAASPPAADKIPEALLEYDQWLCWRAEDRDGKQTKVPIDPETGEFASTTDPATWTTFEQARGQVQAGEADGIGFVFTDDDPIVGIDLDDCRDPETGAIADWAEDVIETLNSYTEISPSGTGFHVLVTGSLPDGRNRKDDLELYETARFFTVTAAHVNGTPTRLQARTDELERVYDEYIGPADNSSGASDSREEAPARTLDDDELLQKATNAANGGKFERLWRGDTSGYESHSEADMALCSLLAFWTGGDAQQMDRLFRESGLMREKWDETHFADGSSYGEKTIERAITGTSEFYEPTDDSPAPSASDVQSSIDAEDVRAREADRLDRIEELEAQLAEVLDEKERLEQELETERTRRKELEAKLEEEQQSERSLFSWR